MTERRQAKLAGVAQFYDGNPAYEWERLARHPVELALTQKAIAEFGPQEPARVLDAGGGPGRYAIWLAQRGHRMTLLDLSRQNLRLAQEKAAQAGVSLAEVVHGDATDLHQFPPECFDAVLLLGPLYHLKEQNPRQQAVCEAVRVLKPGGTLFAAFLNRTALIRYVARYEPELLRDDPALFESLLADGTAYTDLFPDAFSSHSYWSTLAEIGPLMAGSGLIQQALISVEGVVAYIDDQLKNLDGPLLQDWLDLNYRLGKLPENNGLAIHLLYVGQKTAGKTI